MGRKLTEAKHAAAEAQVRRAELRPWLLRQLAASRAIIRAEEERGGDVAEAEKEWEEKLVETRQRAVGRIELSMFEEPLRVRAAAEAMRRVEV